MFDISISKMYQQKSDVWGDQNRFFNVFRFLEKYWIYTFSSRHINMESVQFSKNQLNPDMGHGGLFKFMGAS